MQPTAQAGGGRAGIAQAPEGRKNLAQLLSALGKLAKKRTESRRDGANTLGLKPGHQMMTRPKQILRRLLHCGLLCLAVFAFTGAGDPATRFKELGHQMMCICGCNQILLECNHVGCPDSDGMRNELMTALSRGDSDSLVEQSFVQKYGPTGSPPPPRRALIAPRGSCRSSRWRWGSASWCW